MKRVKLLSPAEGVGARAFVDFHTTAHAGAAVALMGSQVLGRRVAVAYSVKTGGGGGGGAAGGGGVAPPKKRKAFQGCTGRRAAAQSASASEMASYE